MRSCWLLVAILLAPSVAANDGDKAIRLDGEVSTASWTDAEALEVRRALFDDVQALALPGEPLRLEWAGEGRPVVVQHWKNTTSVYRPDGSLVYGHAEARESQTVPMAPGVIELEPVRADAMLRLALDAAARPTRFLDVQSLSIDGVDSKTPADEMQAGIDTQDLNFDFEQVPDRSGYTTFNGCELIAGGAYGIILEGWKVTMTDGTQVFEATATSRSTERVAAPEDVGGSLAVQESRSYFTISGARDHIMLHAAWVQFGGYATAPRVDWTGAAAVHVINGVMDIDGDRMALNGQAVDLWGDFDATFAFNGGDDALTTHLTAVGHGMTNMQGPAPDLGALGQAVMAVPIIDLAAVLVSLVLAALGAVVVRRVHGRRPLTAPSAPPPAAAPPPAPEPPADTPHALVERVRVNPMDAEAHLLLGAQLLDESETDLAVRRLDRAFRLDPLCILRFLEEPRFAPARGHPNVRQLLARIHQERFRKNWIGYV